MQTSSHLVLMSVLTMSLLTSLMLSIIFNLSLSVYPISPHVPLSLYSDIFFCSPRVLQHMPSLLACSVIRFLQSRFVPPLTPVPLHFGHLSIVPSIVSKYLTPLLFLLFCMWMESWTPEILLLFCWYLAPNLLCTEIFFSNGSLILYCSFFLMLSLYFLSFSAPLVTDGLSTLSSWLPHRSELTTKCSEGRAKTSRTFQLLRSNSHHRHFSSLLSSCLLPLILLLTWHVCPWPWPHN